MDGHHRLRRGRCSEGGRIYLITATTRGREPYFRDWTIGATAARAMSGDESWPVSRLLCWVLMPDHWHGIVELGSEPLQLAIGRAKAVVSRDVGRALGRALPLWEPCYHDHALRRDDTLRRVARYVVANPLRAGLVQQVGDYPFWDAVWLQASACGSIAAETAR
jgi:putative transposase